MTKAFRGRLSALPLLILLIIGAITLAACAGYGPGMAGDREGSAPGANAAYRDAKLSPGERAADLLNYMSLEEKLGQLIQVDRQFLARTSDIGHYFIGSILSGGGSTPSQNRPEAWADMYDSFQEAALATRLGIPIIYGIDAVHGNNNLYGAVIFPHNIGLGAAGDPDLVRRIARATAIETAAIGIDWTFAPAVSVPQDIRWGRTYEGFSEEPELAAVLGAAAVEGYQGFRSSNHLDPRLARPENILATAKHFLGDGGTLRGIDQGDVQMSMEEISQRFVPPYVSTIEAGVGSIMASFNSIKGVKVHGDKTLLTDMLRGELGFQGLLVSDWAALKQLPGRAEAQIALGVNAGIDMIMIPDDYPGTIRALKQSVQDGSIQEERINEAVLRILEVKFALGLFEHPYAERELIPQIGSEEHRALAREAVAKSLVVLKNGGENQPLLPVSSGITHILVTGLKADDIGSQAGGWTLDWQGGRGNRIPGTSILSGLSQAAEERGIQLIYRADAVLRDGDPEPDLVITVVGENPYAEMMGDSPSLRLADSEIDTVRKSAALGKPLLSLLISGRPMDIRDILPLSDAFVALWLPGSEGAGVADLVFGKTSPVGRLSYTWPESAEALPLGYGAPSQAGDGVLFPRGYGLSW